MSRSRWLLTALGTALVAALSVWLVGRGLERAPAAGGAPATGAAASARLHVTALSVRGNQIVDQDGAPVRLLGFNNAGTEYACIEGWGIFDGLGNDPTHMPASTVSRMAAWKGANAVRLPLNEQCWLGLGVKPEFGGRAYQRAVHDYVRLLRHQGFVVILDLHRSAPGSAASLEQEQMPDRDHSLTFWSQVAGAYKDDTGVVFDLFNEPWPFKDVDSPRAWQCWRDGGCVLTSQNGGQSYTAAGMNELIAAIRSTGARNVLAVGGIHWAEVLNRWLAYRPSDPVGNLVASFHNYAYNRYCSAVQCYDTVLARVVAAVPLYAGELGPDAVNVVPDKPDQKCPQTSVGHTGFSERILDWLDTHHASYTPWSWNGWGDCYSLVTSYRGTPTPIWGQEVASRLAHNAG